MDQRHYSDSRLAFIPRNPSLLGPSRGTVERGTVSLPTSPILGRQTLPDPVSSHVLTSPNISQHQLKRFLTLRGCRILTGSPLPQRSTPLSRSKKTSSRHKYIPHGPKRTSVQYVRSEHKLGSHVRIVKRPARSVRIRDHVIDASSTV